MKKRMLSLLCVLALCLGLLPATALAAETNTVYVGGKALTGSSDSIVYATTNENGEVITEGATTDNYNIKWDGSTLTLHNASIKKELDYDEYTPAGLNIHGSAIGVLNQSGDAELTIQLEGSNTIDEVSTGIYVYSTGDGAALSITGNSTLAINSTSSTIRVVGSGGNASLSIESAKVTATNSAGYGVIVQSDGNSSASLNMDGGSLTATTQSSGSSGIRLRFGTGGTVDSTPTVTVSNNASVRANGGEGGITSNSSTGVQYGTGSSTTGGIVWNGSEGTVYGDVTLQEDLEIGEGESLTIGDEASLDTNGNTITVENGGKLEGTPTGTVVYAPTITTESLLDGEVGTAYNQTLTATGDSPITWTVSGTLPAGLTLNSNGTISGTPTAAGTSTFTVKAENSAGSATQEYTLTIKSVPVASVSLNESNLSLFTGDTATLTATVQPSNATNKNVTWSSDNEAVATVDNSGKVTAKAPGTATITVTTADGGYTATCKVTVTDPVYKMTTDPTALDFGSVYTGYTQPAAKTVTITNDGNQSLTLTQPASTSSFIVGNLSTTSVPVNGTATFTVQPKAGLAVGTYNESIKVTGSGGATLSIPATFTVRQYISPPTKTPSQQAMDKIEAAKDGDTVEITLSTGNTKLDKEVFEELAGRDVTLEINLPGGVSWTVNGQDIPENATLTDLDMGVSMNTSTIPVNLINMVTGEKGAVQMTLAHDGEFGFTMTLTAPVGTENKGLWANLYHYDTTRKQMLFETASQVDASGNVALKFSHASEYAIVLDTKSHELPFDDVNVGDWFQAAVEYVYRNGIMTGTSVTTFEPGTTLSRAMVAQILYNLEGQPAVTEATTFTDSGTHWAAKAIAWAQETGVVNGYEDNTFRPNKAVTREELAQMLYNYAKVKDYDLAASGDLTAFPDGEEVSSWAETAMAWANGNELINGHDDGTLEPGGDSTRAQAASILMNFDVNLAN